MTNESTPRLTWAQRQALYGQADPEKLKTPDMPALPIRRRPPRNRRTSVRHRSIR